MNEFVFLLTLCLFSIFRNCQEIDEGKNLYNILIEVTVCIVCLIQLLRG